MGILDEAIREHLDLKRRRGADPDEVARQEGEIFGPQRRGGEDLGEPAATELGDALAETHFVDDQQTRLRLAEDPRSPGADAPESVPGTTAAEPYEHEFEAPEEPSPRDALGQETRAFDPEEVRAATTAHEDDEADEGEDDVLDETPEFLAETPEHDRLWFEQRPPRDFDF